MNLILERMAKRVQLPNKDEALSGRDETMPLDYTHAVLGTQMNAPYPENVALIYFGLGCFWGAERAFWQVPGVYTTAVGYMGGYTKNPTYKEVCSGKTAHNEVVLVAYKSDEIDLPSLLETFWTTHNPTQGMRQGNDVGTQYRSGIYFTDAAQEKLARLSLLMFQEALNANNTGAKQSTITTEIVKAENFYFAESYHQQYLHKNPGGYCGLGGLGLDIDLSAIASDRS